MVEWRKSSIFALEFETITNMSRIQDLYKLEERIMDIVDDYLTECYNEEDVLVISLHCGKITLKVDAKDNIMEEKTSELYLLPDLVQIGEDGEPKADIDKIHDIANKWLYLD